MSSYFLLAGKKFDCFVWKEMGVDAHFFTEGGVNQRIPQCFFSHSEAFWLGEVLFPKLFLRFLKSLTKQEVFFLKGSQPTLEEAVLESLRFDGWWCGGGSTLVGGGSDPTPTPLLMSGGPDF